MTKSRMKSTQMSGFTRMLKVASRLNLNAARGGAGGALLFAGAGVSADAVRSAFPTLTVTLSVLVGSLILKESFVPVQRCERKEGRRGSRRGMAAVPIRNSLQTDAGADLRKFLVGGVVTTNEIFENASSNQKESGRKK